MVTIFGTQLMVSGSAPPSLPSPYLSVHLGKVLIFHRIDSTASREASGLKPSHWKNSDIKNHALFLKTYIAFSFWKSIN